ncbi:MAG: hypothetical protein HYX21_00715 [Candidatus Yanofskybacteria bacterium]|nr:hypothetical protein [Candidatus Yanofskybacteria bacterium]
MKEGRFTAKAGFVSLVFSSFLLVTAYLFVMGVIIYFFFWPGLPASLEKTAFGSVYGRGKIFTFDSLDEDTGSIVFKDVYVQGLSDRKTSLYLKVRPEHLSRVRVKTDIYLEGTAISTNIPFFKRIHSHKGRNIFVEVEEVTIWVQNQTEKDEWNNWLANLEKDRDDFLRFRLEKELTAKHLRKVKPS